MTFVTRRVENQVQFFDLLRCIVELRNEKNRKIAPVFQYRSSIIHNLAAS